MAGSNFTIQTGFSASNGPTFVGNLVIAPPATGNNPQQIDQTVIHGATATVWSGNFPYTDLEPSGGLGGGFGFKAIVNSLNSNTSVPSVTIHIMNSTNTVASYALLNGQAVAQATTTGWSGSYTAVTSIQVVGDTTSDFEVFGTLNLNN